MDAQFYVCDYIGLQSPEDIIMMKRRNICQTKINIESTSKTSSHVVCEYILYNFDLTCQSSDIPRI